MSTSECPHCGEPVSDVYQWNYGVEPFNFDGDACVEAAVNRVSGEGEFPMLTLYIHDERSSPSFSGGYGVDPL